MANLSLRHLYKVYPNGVKAVSDFNMEIQDKEFIVFVGPSGCGKSTTLRMIAGLEDITAGELFIGDTLVNDMEPKDRDIAMVFQNYALYPHMTVYDNMAFGLRLRNVPEEEVHRKVLWAAQVLKLTDYLDRKPKAMSGGQRQRVSLGRAILRNPKVFLLDEPLSNLDAKLRTEMRSEISKLHKQLQTTFIYVTHDQVEAMTMGTRIVVMKLGRIQQIDTPKNLYDYPENKFVAGFIGTPQMNFFTCTLLRAGEKVKITIKNASDPLSVSFNDMLKVRPSYLDGAHEVTLGIRCENLSIDPEIVKAAKNTLNVKVSHFEELGAETLIYGDLNPEGDGYSETGTRVIIKSYHGTMDLKPGDMVKCAIDMAKAHFFDQQSELSIVPRIPEVNVFDCSVKAGVAKFLGASVKLPSGLKCPDSEDAELFVPVDALTLGGKDLEAEVENEETINGKHVIYLSKASRTFFLTSPENVKKGQKVGLKIDFKRLSLEKGGAMLLKPFPEYDSFLGAFTNLDNEKKSLKSLISYEKAASEKRVADLENKELAELSAISFQDVLYENYKKAHKAAVANLKGECSYRIGTEEVGHEGKKRIRKETAEKIALADQAYEAQIKALDEQKAKETGLSGEEKASLEQKKTAITSRYEKVIEEEKINEKAREDLILQGASSMVSLREGDKKAAAEAASQIKALEAELKEKKGLVSAEYTQKIATAKTAYENATGDEKDQAKMVYESLGTEKRNALRSLEDQYRFREDEILFASKTFFAYINGYGVVTPKDLNKKVVKSLGLDIFNSQFRYQIPHEGFHLTQQGGIDAVVVETQDYGDGLYAHCVSHGSDIYVKIDEAFKAGTIIRLTIDLSKARVVENKFDIALN
jgi:multiple sugar transport system ATP-binding protein